MATSNYGLGSVRQRRDGRWEWAAPPSLGRKSIYGKSRREVLDKARAWMASKPEAPRTAKAEDRNLAEVVDAFLTAAEDRIRPATLAQYRSLLRTHIVPRRGQLPIARVKREHIEALYAELKDRGASMRTMQAVHIAFRQVTAFAVERRWIDADPMAGLRRPGGSKQARVKAETAIRYWAADELKQVLAAAHYVLTPQQALIFEVLAWTGCRISEALGLRFRDHGRGRLSLVRTFSKSRQIEPMKSETSRRTVDVPPALSRLIEDERARRGAGLDDYLFATATGTPIDQDRARKLLGKVVMAAGVPARTLHEIRHSHAVMLLESGVSLKAVQLRLGHADAATTMRTYAHVTPAMDSRLMNALQGALGEE